MRYAVEGIDRRTGAKNAKEIAAASEEEAVRLAGQGGLAVKRIYRMPDNARPFVAAEPAAAENPLNPSSPAVLPYFNALDRAGPVRPCRTLAGKASVFCTVQLIGLPIALGAIGPGNLGALLVLVFGLIALCSFTYIAFKRHQLTRADTTSVALLAAIALGWVASAIAAFLFFRQMTGPQLPLLFMVMALATFTAAVGLAITGLVVSRGRCLWSWGGLAADVAAVVFVAYALSYRGMR